MTPPSTGQPAPRTIEQMRSAIGSRIGVSDWAPIDQRRIDLFADVTADRQYIHVDPEKAAAGPFGQTIAHGFLSLSLLSEMASSGLPPIDGVSTNLNYGFDKVRFISPVPFGARIRGLFTLTEVSSRAPGQTLLRYQVEIEIDGAKKPAVVADWLVLAMTDEAGSK
ncbi:MAG: nodulation protein NodN [Rhizobiales bacterium 65-9]|nr:MaoC family dehydratase [Hyphomicrobiales bacterium]OJY35313.1 MAG: nodulation protein NodN [Rhizobiales bacterium 65-9]